MAFGHIVTVDDDRRRADIERRAPRESGHRVFVVERQSIVECLPRHGAIHRAGVEMFVVEPPRDLARDGAFAGAGRTVNGDNQTTRGHVGQYIRAVRWVLGAGSGSVLEPLSFAIRRNSMRRVMMLVLATVFSATLGLTAQQPVDPNRWEPAIQKFEAEDKANPPAKGGIVFIGASSIVRWSNLARVVSRSAKR